MAPGNGERNVPSCFTPLQLLRSIDIHRKIEFKKGKTVEVKMSVQYMSFSAHADAKGTA